MFNVDKFFEFERVQKWVDLFDFGAFELSNAKSIDFFDIEDFAGFGDLSV